MHLFSVQIRLTFPSRKIKISIVFDDMIADVMTNKKFQAIIDAEN